MSQETEAVTSTQIETAAEIADRRRNALHKVFDEKYVAGYLGPIAYLDNQTLESPAAISFYTRQFGYVSKVLQYEYQYRSWNGYDQALLDRYAEIVTKKLNSIAELLKNNKNRLSKILQSNGVQMESTVYNNPLHTTVPIISNHARVYFMVLKDLDAVNLMAGAANLMGVIDSSQRSQAEFLCKKAVRAFEALLRNEVLRIYREANRLMNEQHGGAKADPERAQTVAAQGAELQAFGDAMQNEGKTDRSLNLDGVDPGTLIDDVASATAAMAKAGGARKKKDDAAQESVAASS